jgi:hypothetical protein
MVGGKRCVRLKKNVAAGLAMMPTPPRQTTLEASV